MVDITKLKELKQGESLERLDIDRKRAIVTSRILASIENEALSADEVANRLNISKSTAYNALRRYEKYKKTVVAFYVNGDIVFLSKKKAETEGLI